MYFNACRLFLFYIFTLLLIMSWFFSANSVQMYNRNIPFNFETFDVTKRTETQKHDLFYFSKHQITAKRRNVATFHNPLVVKPPVKRKSFIHTSIRDLRVWWYPTFCLLVATYEELTGSNLHPTLGIHNVSTSNLSKCPNFNIYCLQRINWTVLQFIFNIIFDNSRFNILPDDDST